MTSLRIRIRFIQACSILWMLCAAAAMPARQVGAATTTAAATTAPDVCGYPDGSNLPRSAAIFNESAVLRAFSPVSTTTTARGQGLTIKMWYNDEHALTLGVRRVVVKSSSGTTTTNYPFTATPSSPATVVSPQVGATAASGDQTGNDVAVGGGRPMWPVLFITDLTLNGTSSRAGDWQQGGIGVAPQKVSGIWKGAVRTVDKTVSPAKVTITPDADPAKNGWAGIPDAPPSGCASLKHEGYG